VTQDTDVPGVVRSRFKYAVMAAIPALLCFAIFGGASEGLGLNPEKAAEFMDKSSNPAGLIFMIPFGLVIFLAMRGNHLIVSLTWGIIAASVLGIVTGLVSPSGIFFVDSEGGIVGGSILNGVKGYISMAVLILLIVAAGHIMTLGGTMETIKKWLATRVGKSPTRAELSIMSLVTSLNVFITINTAAEIAAAPFVKEVGEDFRIHPYRRANLLDATTSALGYIFPWSGAVLLGASTLKGLAQTYDFVQMIPTTKVWPFVFHGWFLLAVMIVAASTGLFRTFSDEHGNPVKELPPNAEIGLGSRKEQ
ncbi:MAG: Na+/H+ antiporter NhaC family protein, partial [Desulfobacteraceae bacterium]|nr:Na+/H+ antiporter NhaC family protein [Desulfobacteraceae bacterium]